MSIIRNFRVFLHATFHIPTITYRQMKHQFLILIILIFSGLAFGQKIDKYVADVNLDKVTKSLKANFNIKFGDLKKGDTLKLFVQESSIIHTISSVDMPIPFELSDEKLVGEDKAILIPVKTISDNMVDT